MKKNMINLRMVEFYRLGIVVLMLVSWTGRMSAQASITIMESSGAMSNDGIILCGASVTLTAHPAGNTYLWSTMHTTQAINVNLGGTYTVTVTDASTMTTSTASVVITVTNDNTPPVAKCDTITVQLDASGEVLVDLADIDDGSLDACSQVSLNVQDWFTAGPNCANAVCVSDTMQFRSAVDGADGGYSSNCPIASTFESWAYFQVTTAGTINMMIEATPPPGPIGYDAAVWGPFSSPDCSQLNLATEKYCELDVSGGRRIMFTAATGYYMLMVTNPDNAAGFISLHDNKGTAVIQSPCSSNNTTSTHIYRCADIGNQVVRLRVTDTSGNTATCNAVVKVEDNIDPVITCPPGRTLPSCGSLLPPMTSDVVAEDNCIPTVTQYPLPFTNVGDFDGDTTIVTFTVTDASANTASCTTVVTIDDSTLPTPFCHGTLLRNLNGSGSFTLTYSLLNIATTDDCTVPSNLVFEVFPKDLFTCADTGTTVVGLNVWDEGGNAASCFTELTLNDGNSPVVTCPPNTTVSCTDLVPNLLPQLVANDNCTSSSNIVKTQSPAAGSALVPPGPITVTFTATDYSGNTSTKTCTGLITVTDAVLPVITCPASETLNNDAGLCGRVYTFTFPVATDNCGTPAVTLTSGPTSGSTLPVGVTTFVFRATDLAGNTATCSRTVTINDVSAPVAICRNYTASLNGSGAVTVTGADLNNGSSDNCGGTLTFTHTSSYTCADIGTSHTATLVVTDIHGNTASCASVVTVQDNTPPVASCADITVSLGSDGTVAINPADLNNNSADNCPGTLSFSASPSTFTCSETGIQQVTLTVTDAQNNSSVCTSSVTVEDNGVPIAVCKNLTVDLDGQGMATVAGSQLDGGSTDGCSSSGSLTFDPEMISYDCASVGTHIVTLTVTDGNGNSATCTSTVIVRDILEPSVLCQNVTASLDPSGAVTVLATQVDNGSGDNCGGTLSFMPASFSYTCADLGVQNITLTVTDTHSNSGTCTAQITVQDVMTPTALCKPATVFLDGAGIGSVSAAQLNNNSTDNCLSAGPLTFSPGTITYNCAQVGVQTAVLTVTDAQGNTSSCTAAVTVADNIAPVAVCQGITVSLNASGAATVTGAQINNGSADNCTDPASLQLTPLEFTFDCSNIGSNTVTLSVGDTHGNTSACTAVVTVQDNTDPVAVCQNLTLSLDASGIVTVTGAQMGSGSSDNCQGALTFSPEEIEYNCSNIGTSTIQLIVTDAENNTASCSSVLTVEDNMAPVAICRNITLPLNAQGVATGLVADLNNGSTDNCTAAGLLTFAASESLSYTCAELGQRTVNLTVTDVAGNAATCTSVVTVTDPVPPVITQCPANLTVNDCSALIPDLTAGVISTDNCVTILSTTQTPPAGSGLGLLGPGNTITFTVTDQNGNTATCSNMIITDDTVPPQFTVCPANISVSNQTDNCGAHVMLTVPTATDNCGTPAVVRTGGLAENALFPVGVTVQIYQATDAGMNTAVCSFSVTVSDTQAPVAICGNPLVLLDPQGTGSLQPAALNGNSTDNCTASGQLIFNTTDNLSFNCTDLGPNTVTLTVSDAAGNTASCTAVVTVADQLAPVAGCRNRTFSLNGSSVTVVPGELNDGSSDNCTLAGNLTFSANGLTFNCSDLGDHIVTLVVTDEKGNTGICTSVVTISDNTAPVASCRNTAVSLEASGTVSIPGSSLNNNSTDNCTAANELAFTPSTITFNCQQMGANTITLTVSDVSGNSATCTSVITVNDVIAPQAVCKNITVSLDNNGSAAVNGASLNGSSSDNCTTGAALVFTPASITYQCTDIGQHTVTLTVTDASLNSATCTSVVTVSDNTPPVASCRNLSLSLDISGQASLSAAQLNLNSADNCAGQLQFTASSTVFICDDIGNNTVTLTVTDVAGNTSTCTSIVTVADNTAPVARCSSQVVTLDAAGVAVVTASQLDDNSSDNCTQAADLTFLPPQITYTCADAGANTVTLTVTDAEGNSSTCTAVLQVTDSTDPEIVHCPDNAGVGDCVALVPDMLAGLEAGDNCGVMSVTQTPPAGSSQGDLGPGNTVTFTVTDAHGNTTTCIAEVLVDDMVPPVFTNCPDDVVLENNPGTCTQAFNVMVPAATDNCSGVTVTQTAGLSGLATFPVGTTIQTFEATDAALNKSTCVYTVTVEDTEAPHPHCQSAFLSLGTDGLVTITGAELAPTSTDNCTAPGMLVFEPASVTYECADAIGQHVVVVQATDEAGNSWTCVSTIIVSDYLPPVITTCPGNVTVNDCNALIPDLTTQLVVSDNCEIASVDQFPAGGSELADLGPDRVIAFVVTDPGSNVSICSARLSVQDEIPPVFISCPADLTIGNDYDECGAVFFMDDPEATDNCTEVTVIQTEGLAWNTFFPIGVTTQLFEATDSAGNTTVCMFNITVEDTQAPAVFCADQTIYLSATGTAEILAQQIDGGAYDNCTLSSDLVFIPTAYQFDCTDAGERSVTLRVRDEAGNIDSCFALITVLDVNSPAITSCPQTYTLNGCSGGMPDLTQLVTATDVCGIAEITQDPEAGTNLAPYYGSMTTLTFVVSDFTGNASSCQTTLQITDSTPPSFQNCPTSTVFVSNITGLCGTVLDWTVPVANDDCSQASIVQVSGPTRGAVVSVNCPPTLQTVVYRATDTAGNSVTCSFQVAAVDMESPVIHPSVVALSEVDIECNQLEPGCVIRTSGQCIPLTGSDVTDNCTGPTGLNITVTETSTKAADPASCNFYNYTLVRTWRVTDCAGNSTIFTQKINVHDTTPPVAVCQSDTVALGGSGTYVLGSQVLDAGSYDNCALYNRLSFQLSKTNFNCDNIGDNLIVMTVQDPCGNTDTCHANVHILEGSGKCHPVYDPAGSEPCVCLNNATTPVNGQFSEIIQMEAKDGLVLTVKTSTGLFMPNSPAPPAAPVPVPAGALLAAGLSDGIDNDRDNITDEPDENTWYTLRARHVEGIGYTAVIRASNGDEVSLSNKCFYPEPRFAGLSDTLCLGTPVFDIEVEEVNGADGTVGDTRVNGTPATQFHAAQLGAGTHQVQSVFDAGSAHPYRIVDGVALDGTEAQAKADPGCQYKINKTVVVLPSVSVVSCKDTVTVNLDTICEVTLTGADVLSGTYRCPEDYLVNIDRVSPPGNGPWGSPDIDSSDIGKVYGYRLVDVIAGTTKCTGIVKIKNDQPPVLTCPADVTIGCSEPVDISHTGDVMIDYCLYVTKTIEDIITENDVCENPRRSILRRFKVVDNQGRQTSCEQEISVMVFDLGDVVFPANITISCDEVYGDTAATSPSVTGAPSINGYPVSESTFCDVLVTYDETRYESCGGSYGILRNWRVLNRCLPISPTNPLNDTQRIEVKDEGGPRFNCPTVATVSVDSAGCCSTNGLAPLIISEGCSGIIDLVANVVSQNPQPGIPPLFTVSGFLVDFPGNNYQLADTLAVFPYPACLPNGSSYIVTCTASDSCGNTSSCQYELKIGDLIEPVAKCSSFTQVNLPVSGMQTLTAVSLNNGSSDNCTGTNLGYKIRRSQGNACEPGVYFDDDIKLCCADIGDTVLAVVRVYDVQIPADTVSASAFEGHYTDCQTRIFVTEQNKPVCTPPANATVVCSDFNEDLSAYGQAMVADECCVDTVITLANYSQFDTICTRGTITRTFRVFDCAGNQAQCTQQIQVNYEQDYYIRFPDDVIVTNCNGGTDFGEPVFTGINCENMQVTYEDDISTQVPDACYRINRRWKILNGCTYDSTLTCINVLNPTPEAVINHPLNLLGPVVSPVQTQGDPWKSTILKITTNDPQPTNFSVFYSASANCYTYTQTIKISDDRPPVPVYPAADTIRDMTQNDTMLWNEPYWWNSHTQMSDLCDAPSDISISVTDSCSGANLDIKYILFLDLDGDGTTESFVDSEELGSGGLGWNTVLYGNGTGPGDPRTFDKRPVAPNQKWGFAYQEEVSGQQVTARVRFNTQADQNTYTDPMLPHGSHRIRWIIRDGCGNDTICDYPVIIRDGAGPTLVCRDSVVAVLNSDGQVAVQAVSLLVSATDNCSRLDDLELAFRLCGFGSGFPLNQWGQPASADTFGCINRGVFCVEAWALDPSGNSSNCETQLIIRDFNNVCPGGPNINLTGMIKTEIGRGVGIVNVKAEGSNGVTGSFSYSDMTDTLGNYEIINQIPRGSDFLVTPLKNINHLNGITTYDLVLISRHILGIAALGSPYKLIAADANRSNSVTTFDIVEFRKLILGIYQTIPNNTSWRFVDSEQVFTNPLNPFLDSIHERVFVDSALFNRNINFIGIKVGDVNASTEPGNAISPDDRTVGTLYLDAEDRDIQAGDVFSVTFSASAPSDGYQFTMNTEDLELVAVPPSGKVTEGNFGVFPGAITASIDGDESFTLTFAAKTSGKLSEMLGISSRLTRSIGYDTGGNPLDMALRFDDRTVSEVGFELYQNVPNPFSNVTSIGFNLPEAGPATLQIFDQTGRLLFSQTGHYTRGYQTILLESSLPFKPGVLYYQLKTEKQTATRKMVMEE